MLVALKLAHAADTFLPKADCSVMAAASMSAIACTRNCADVRAMSLPSTSPCSARRALISPSLAWAAASAAMTAGLRYRKVMRAAQMARPPATAAEIQHAVPSDRSRHWLFLDPVWAMKTTSTKNMMNTHTGSTYRPRSNERGERSTIARSGRKSRVTNAPATRGETIQDRKTDTKPPTKGKVAFLPTQLTAPPPYVARAKPIVAPTVVCVVDTGSCGGGWVRGGVGEGRGG